MKQLRVIGGVFCALLLAALPAWAGETLPVGELVPVEYVRTIDGDTIVVKRDGVEEHVRLIGIDAPELDEGKQEAFYAAQHMARECENAGMLFLEFDPEAGEKDVFGRTLAWVWEMNKDATYLSLLNDYLQEFGAKFSPQYKFTNYRNELPAEGSTWCNNSLIVGIAAGKAIPLAEARLRNIKPPDLSELDEMIVEASGAADEAASPAGDESRPDKFDPRNPNSWVEVRYTPGDCTVDDYGTTYYLLVGNWSDQLLSLVSVELYAFDGQERVLGSGINNLSNLAGGQAKWLKVRIPDVQAQAIEKITWQASAYQY